MQKLFKNKSSCKNTVHTSSKVCMFCFKWKRSLNIQCKQKCISLVLQSTIKCNLSGHLVFLPGSASNASTFATKNPSSSLWAQTSDRPVLPRFQRQPRHLVNLPFLSASWAHVEVAVNFQEKPSTCTEWCTLKHGHFISLLFHSFCALAKETCWDKAPKKGFAKRGQPPLIAKEQSVPKRWDKIYDNMGQNSGFSSSLELRGGVGHAHFVGDPTSVTTKWCNSIFFALQNERFNPTSKSGSLQNGRAQHL